MELLATAECWAFRLNHPDEWATFGCGPGGFGDVLVPDTMWGLDISVACRIHDFDYRHGEDRSKKAWRKANSRMRKNTLMIVREKSKRWWIKRLRITRCGTYYVFVSSPFGWMAWREDRSVKDIKNGSR